MGNLSFFCCSIFEVENSSLSIASSVFQNLVLSSNFIFFESTLDSKMIVKDTEFKNITFLKSTNLFHLSGLTSNGSIFIFSSMFKTIRYLENILFFEKIMASILLELLIFEKNVIKSQIINIQYSFNISIGNVLINLTNYNDDVACEQQCGGGAIKLMDIFYKNLFNISIIFLFSTHSTLAVKIIDTLKRKMQPFYQPVRTKNLSHINFSSQGSQTAYFQIIFYPLLKVIKQEEHYILIVLIQL